MASRLFYQNRLPRPELDRAEGIYMYAKRATVSGWIIRSDGQQYRAFQSGGA